MKHSCAACGKPATWVVVLSYYMWNDDLVFYYCTYHKDTHILVEAYIIEAFAIGSHTIAIDWMPLV